MGVGHGRRVSRRAVQGANLTQNGGAMQSEVTWQEYWQVDRLWRDCALWETNAQIFLDRARPLVGFGREDRVLNIGCGAGHLERRLAPLVREVLAVDTAPQFVDLCRERCRGLANVDVARLGGNYTDLSAFGRTFTRVLCVSVVQYYRNLGEVKDLIDSATRVLEPGGLLLIGDLPMQQTPLGFARDAVVSCARGLRHGYGVALVVTAARRWLGGSAYRSFSARCPELRFGRVELDDLVKRQQPNGRILKDGLSVYANRPSLLIRA